MEQLSVIESQESYCKYHNNRQIQYACMEINQPQKFMCSLCLLKGRFSQNVNDFLYIKEIQENNQKLPIQNWPKNISPDLIDHLHHDISECRSEMEQKITSYFKQLQSSIIVSIEKQQKKTLDIFNDLYDELEQQIQNYNKFFQREKLHEIFQNGTYSDQSFTQLQNEIEETKVQNLQYLEQRRKQAEIFEKKVFQQPHEISNAINLLLLNIDFFESEDLRSIIPNYNKIIKENDTSDYNSLIAKQTLYQINQSSKLQQLIFEQNQIIEYRNKKSLFEKQTDSDVFSDAQDILNQLKAKEQNVFDKVNDQQQKNNLIQKLENLLISFNQKYTGQNFKNSIKKMESEEFTQVIKQIENIYQKDCQKDKVFCAVTYLQQNTVLWHLQTLFNMLVNIKNKQKLEFAIIASNYGTRPTIQNETVTISNYGQVYFDIQMKKEKTYVILLKIHTYKNSGDFKFGLIKNGYANYEIGSYSNTIIYISTISSNNINLIRGQQIKKDNIPQYLEIRVNIEKQLFQISDYPSYKNVIQYSGRFDTSPSYQFGFGSYQSDQTISVEYLEETDEFIKF
ncbi:hypothetical protein TTHERM_00197840 (macronuclear) [Tetrahymena thermophila SB210]|uniref:Uncharacterized protein n=1 Tax=Tetrahymena thermophila (strain SB210) TaxID=312017 RepID=Q22NR5_TETTS|nr:hypothetical protein TTHERM_00197840 [Tetrahymena thermophila SB210]EAR86720.1 hypothetical protein TTHERM_00197840 [Tetrahymena thermophila SB210]|eukprot:XP_001006965.1 hypothetical protein TTHERM_00197840 [Tetrahymena thermophila SB210]